MVQNFDLFGVPVRERRDVAGRPSHEPTDANRNKIMLLFALGWKAKMVAAAMMLSMPTFRKHYFSEIKQASDALLRVKARHIERVWTKAETGDMGAIKEVGRMIDRFEASHFAQDDDDYQPLRPARLGKKEAAKVAAGSAGVDTEWGNDLLVAGSKPN